MASVMHIAEVAAILAVAYGLGWLVGYAAHRLVARRPAPVAGVPRERMAAVTGAPAEALVKAPVIGPLPKVAPPPDAAVAAEPAPQAVAIAPEPAREAVFEPEDAPDPAVPPHAAALAESTPAVTPLMPVAIPRTEPPPPMAVEPLEPLPKPAPEPGPEAEPEVILTAAPAMKPGEAWSGEVRGRSAPAVAAEAAAEEAAGAPTSQLDVALAFDLGPVGPDSTYGEPVLPQSPPLPADVDEDAAMRAIEGGWSRTGTPALPDAPELIDVGAAVAAAQTAVEQVLAEAGIDAQTVERARPKGLSRPRNGVADDLKRIEGLGALDESTLNNLGVFHFDQIAGWSEAQVLWMENHVFARGRIGRENWQQQARDLAAAVAS